MAERITDIIFLIITCASHPLVPHDQMAQQPSTQYESAMQRKFRSAKAVIRKGKGITPANDPYAPRPIWYFFYGTLKDPSWLASIAGLEELPDVMYAKVHMWGFGTGANTRFLCTARPVLLLKGWPSLLPVLK